MLMKVLPTIGKSTEALQFFLSMTYAVNEKRKSELDLIWILQTKFKLLGVF